jgi:uncharacterized protein YukE
MTALYMPAGDPEALEAAANSLRGYAGQIETLSAATRSTAGRVVANADWTGASANAYTAFTTSFATGMDGLQDPLRGIPAAVSGYGAALADAQAKVTSYQTFAQGVNSSGGLVTVEEKAAIEAEAQQLMTEAEAALGTLERTADEAVRVLKGIGKLLDDVFGSEGPVRTWLENATRPWDSVGADEILEQLLNRGKDLEEEFKEAEKAFEEAGKATKAAKAAVAAKLEATLASDFKDIVGGVMKDMLTGKANVGDLANAVQNYEALAQWTRGDAAAETAAIEAGAVSAPTKAALLKLLPYLQKLGIAADALGIIGGTYTVFSPPDYDTGGARPAAQVAGGALALGSAAGLAGGLAEAGVLSGSVSGAVLGTLFGTSLTIPGVGEAVAAAAGLYLVGDWAYHNTHLISHTFDSARHTAAHIADDLTSWL